MKAIFSNEVLDVKDYVEKIIGNRPCYTTLEEMERDFEENDVCLWNYPICEVEHIIQNELKVCLVRFTTLYGGYEYRWCEMENFQEEDLLLELNKMFDIKVENDVAYLTEDNTIIANNQKELIEWYIKAYEYKYSLTFEDETETRKHYIKIINELKELLNGK